MLQVSHDQIKMNYFKVITLKQHNKRNNCYIFNYTKQIQTIYLYIYIYLILYIYAYVLLYYIYTSIYIYFLLPTAVMQWLELSPTTGRAKMRFHFDSSKTKLKRGAARKFNETTSSPMLKRLFSTWFWRPL